MSDILVSNEARIPEIEIQRFMVILEDQETIDKSTPENSYSKKEKVE